MHFYWCKYVSKYGEYSQYNDNSNYNDDDDDDDDDDDTKKSHKQYTHTI